MGYAVYWANGRWQGYGIPAYCDYPGCKKEIDLGMGYQHPEDEENGSWYPAVFCCNDHRYEDLESFGADYGREHPEWLEFILSDGSWKEWRGQNPEIVEKYQRLLKEASNEL